MSYQLTIMDLTGEIIKYSFNQTSISGINTSDEYYVTKIDKNNFKLSLVGVGTTNKDFYLKTTFQMI